MKSITQKTQSIINRLSSLGGRVFIISLALGLLSGGLYISQVYAQSAPPVTGYSVSSGEYCINITPTGKKSACQDGWDDAQPCSNLNEMTFDPSLAPSDLVKVCESARSDALTCAKAAKDGKTIDKNTLKLSSSPGCPKDVAKALEETDICAAEDKKNTAECDPVKLQQQIDNLCEKVDENKASEQVKNICKFGTSQAKQDDENSDNGGSGGGGGGGGGGQSSQEKTKMNKDVQALKKAAEPPLPDNKYGQYVNGANKYQSIRVNRAPGDGNAAFVLIHGGGWMSDDGAADKFAKKANERGYTTFVATYRLGAGGVYYQLDDVLRAMHHVRDNAGMYGVDPGKIGIWGDSAGGSLAIRAAATGQSGARAAVGWSAPTNAYTAIFHSPESFAIGMFHSTCATSGPGGMEDMQVQINGDGTSYGGTAGTSLELAQQAQQSSTTPENISASASDSGDDSGNMRRFAAKKFLECIDNFNSASPALFASAQTPPTFLAGYDTDPVVGQDQIYQMRDKLRSIGVPAEALVLPGEPGPLKPGENHLDYHDKFVNPTLEFTDKFLHPKKQ